MLTLLPGVRFEYHDPYGFVAAPRLAMALRPNDTWMLRVSAGRGYRTPSPEELGFNFDHSIYGYKVVGNSALSPESSWGVNGDVTFRPDSHFTLRAGAYANWVDDLIDIDLSGGKSSGTVVTYSYSNFDRVTTAGASASLSYRLGERLLVELSYDYLYAHDTVNDVPLAGRPPHTLTTSMRAQLPWKFELYARARVISHAFVDTNTVSPGYYTVDLRLSRPIWRSIEAYVGGLNLFDVHQDPGVVGDLRPPLGRVFYGGLRAAFPWEKI
jgi:outer membrane receptor for ferrienterochelin and colicins